MEVAVLPFLVALFVFGLSAFGLLAPTAFVELVARFQQPPVIYVAAFIRFAVGVILLRGASKSRTPQLVRVLGAAIAIGGLLTPFLGVWLGETILRWWHAGGDSTVRVWAGTGAMLGVFLSIVLRPGLGRSPA